MTMTRLDLDRRALLLGATALAGLAACGPNMAAAAQPNAAASRANEARFANDPVRRISDAEWLRRLPSESYRILRHEDTEAPGTGPFNDEKRRGTYLCRGCDLPLFKSEWKFESGTGWPSFFDVIKENIGTKTDMLIGVPRTEYHCAKCLGHHGHVFGDGPRPTGLRYCNNGHALKFQPA